MTRKNQAYLDKSQLPTKPIRNTLRDTHHTVNVVCNAEKTEKTKNYEHFKRI